MDALLGKGRVVDDPRFDRTLPLDRGQDHLPHLGQNRRVQPTPFPDEVQQRLMLGRRSPRRRHRRYRLHALAFARQQKSRAIIPQRLGPVRVTDHADKPLDIGRKPRLAALSPKIHPSLPC